MTDVSQKDEDYELITSTDRLEIGKTYFRKTWGTRLDRDTGRQIYGNFYEPYRIVKKSRKGTYGDRVEDEFGNMWYAEGCYIGRNKRTDYVSASIRYKLKDNTSKGHVQLSLFEFVDDLS